MAIPAMTERKRIMAQLGAIGLKWQMAMEVEHWIRLAFGSLL